jgi:hypothetical protein
MHETPTLSMRQCKWHAMYVLFAQMLHCNSQCGHIASSLIIHIPDSSAWQLLMPSWFMLRYVTGSTQQGAGTPLGANERLIYSYSC